MVSLDFHPLGHIQARRHDTLGYWHVGNSPSAQSGQSDARWSPGLHLDNGSFCIPHFDKSWLLVACSLNCHLFQSAPAEKHACTEPLRIKASWFSTTARIPKLQLSLLLLLGGGERVYQWRFYKQGACLRPQVTKQNDAQHAIKTKLSHSRWSVLGNFNPTDQNPWRMLNIWLWLRCFWVTTLQK